LSKTQIKPILSEWESFSNYKTGFIAEPKYDGMRLLISKLDGKINLFRENGKIKNLYFPEILESANSLPENTIIDGELCILESNLTSNFFKLLQRSTNNPTKIKLSSKLMPTTFVAFDILMYDGLDLTGEKLSLRKTFIDRIIERNPKQDRIIPIKFFSPDDLLQINESVKGLEGIVIKNESENYYNSRWHKFKNFLEDDFKVIGFTSEIRPISALMLQDQDGKYVGDVNYTGYPQTDEMKKTLVGKTAVIRYLSKGEKLRFPILKELKA
jgi:ATP-dependent DNA ligase